jgi:hypothetical protein
MVVIRAGAKSFGSPAAKAWLGFEIRWAFCFFKEGVLVDATVSRREWISFGSQGRNLRNTVAFQNEIETKEYPIEYLSLLDSRNSMSAIECRY